MLKGGTKSFYAVLAILKGGANNVHSLKNGGGGYKKFRTSDFPVL